VLPSMYGSTFKIVRFDGPLVTLLHSALATEDKVAMQIAAAMKLNFMTISFPGASGIFVVELLRSVAGLLPASKAVLRWRSDGVKSSENCCHAYRPCFKIHERQILLFRCSVFRAGVVDPSAAIYTLTWVTWRFTRSV
jgi:hypothetical protein